MRAYPIYNQHGFTLIEVLVAMIILAGGLLGLAASQTLGIKSARSAYNRSQATQLANDLADRMRANRGALSVFTTKGSDEVTAKPNCKTTTGCSPAEMAENDLFEWYASVNATLPGASLDYKPQVANGVYTITLRWDDNQDGDNSSDIIFTTSFRL